MKNFFFDIRVLRGEFVYSPHIAALVLVVSFLVSFFPLVGVAGEAAPEGGAKAGGPLVVKGVPKLVRSNPQSEVFFFGVPGGYVIPSNSGHNRIFNALMKAQVEKKSIGIYIDPKTSNVLGLDTDQVSAPVAVKSAEEESPWIVPDKKESLIPPPPPTKGK